MVEKIDEVMNWKQSVVPKVAIAVVALAFLAVAVKLFFSISTTKQTEITDLERSLQDIRAAMNQDSVRQYTIQKVMRIISRYNNDLLSSQKYEIADEVYRMSVKYTNLDVDLICATITYESGLTWDTEVVSSAGAMGLMQIMPTQGMWLAHYEGITWTNSQEVLFNPIYNIRIGTRYLAALIEAYELEGGLAAYNGGEKRAATWMANNKAEGILLNETSNYIPTVLELYEEFKSLRL